MRALVVEDEAALREGLKEQLAKQGFTVDVAADGEEGLFAGKEYPLDIAVVDLGLPRISGLDLIRSLRKEGKTFPILILTARDRWQDKVEGLQAGADDYVAKPYHFEEVLARMQALLRRAGGWASPVLECGPIRLDTRAQTVTLNGNPIELTTFEYRILEHMMLRAGDVILEVDGKLVTGLDRFEQLVRRDAQRRNGNMSFLVLRAARTRLLFLDTGWEKSQ